MNFYIDLNTNELIEASGFRKPVNDIDFINGDTVKTKLYFFDSDGAATLPADEIRLALKQTYTGDPLVYSAAWNSGADHYYSYVNYNTTELSGALGDSNSISAYFEVTWSGDNEWQTTPKIASTIHNDVIKLSESPSTPVNSNWQNLVYTTGDQTISGEKTFADRPTVNGSGVILEGETAAGAPQTLTYSDGSLSISEGNTVNLSDKVATTGDETINGTKNFASRPTVNGTGVLLSGEAAGGDFATEEYVDNISGNLDSRIDILEGYSGVWSQAYNDNIDSVSFDTGNGVLTLSKRGGGSFTKDLDGRYLLNSAQATDSDQLDGQEGTYYLDFNNLNNVPTGFTPESHTHDDRYYTESEVDTISGNLQSDIDSKIDGTNVVFTTGANDFVNRPTVGGVGVLLSGEGGDAGSGITSLNTLDGAITLAGAGNVTITDNGTDTITISGSASESGDYATEAYVNNVSGDLSDRLDPLESSSSAWTIAYNDKINSMAFNTGNGVLTLNQEDGSSLTQDLDGRYLDATGQAADSDQLDGQEGTYYLDFNNLSNVPTGFTPESHTHTIGQITDFTDNSSNWDAAYADKINSMAFNTGNGILTLTQQDAGTVTEDLDGRYLVQTGQAIDSDKLDGQEGAYYLDYGNLTSVPTGFTPISHTHDDRYYTESEVDTISGNLQSDIDNCLTAESDTLDAVISRGSSTNTAPSFNSGASFGVRPTVNGTGVLLSGEASAGSGISSLNTLEGDVTLQGAGSVSITDNGTDTITVSGSSQEKYVTLYELNGSGSISWDMESGYIGKMYDISGDVTLTISNLDEGPDGVLYFQQDASGGHLITVTGAGLTPIGDVSITSDMTSGNRGVLTFAKVGTDLYQQINTDFN